MKTIKRLSQSKVLLEGVIWDTNYNKAIKYKSPETGFVQHSIVVEGIYYYPISINGKNTDSFELENSID